MALLKPGDEFPALTLNLTGGGTLEVPSAFAGSYAVVLFNRGSWCPYCVGQLRAFQRALPKFEEAGIKIVSLSVDDEPTARAMIDDNKLTFPIAYGADAPKIAALTGAFVNAQPLHLQSTGFVLDPDGKVAISVYSSGAIGRLVPDDVLGMVRYMSEH
jgi:peroxiredoxin